MLGLKNMDINMPKFKRKRISTNKASAILLSDWHIRENQPACRIDNFWGAQERKMDFILNLAKEHACPILVSGDLGHKPRWSCKLLEWFISKVNNANVKIICIAGQHDILEHRLETWFQSGIGVLHAAGAVEFISSPKIINNEFVVYPFSYGEGITVPKKNNSELPKIAMIHQMVVEKKDLFPDQNALKSHSLLKQFPCYDLIHSGDNHLPFVSEYNGKILCNPGSIMRMTAIQIGHRPKIYLYKADTNTVEAVYLPIERGVVTRLHIEDKEIRDKRMDAFVSRMTDDFEVALSFENNLEEYFRTNRTKQSVVDKTWEAIG